MGLFGYKEVSINCKNVTSGKVIVECYDDIIPFGKYMTECSLSSHLKHSIFEAINPRYISQVGINRTQALDLPITKI